MVIAMSPGCFSTRLARIGRHLDRGEWASCHALLVGQRQCALRRGCPDGESCGVAAEMLMCDVRGLVHD